MKAEAFRRLQHLFEAALQVPRDAREAWIREACDGDTDLEVELSRLLRVEEATAGAFEDELIVQLGDAAKALTERAWAEGARIGRYRIVREIGRGGMGRVYAAVFQDGDVERDVAIKVLHREAWSDGLARRFLRERRLLAALQHPGIARLLDVGESADGEPYLVMDLVLGLPITMFCAERHSPMPERLRLFAQVLRAVSHAHRNLILHRDLKPGNVLVDDDGHARLLDFGIAKMVGAEEDLTQVHGRMLTPTYAAPEQLDGRIESGVASDIYSLGALLYELVAGRPPFPKEGLSTGEFERRVREVPPPPLARSFAGLGDPAGALGVSDRKAWSRALAGDIDAVVQKALRKNPAERYASVEAFEEDVQALLDRRPVRARAGGTLYRAQRFVSRHRWAVSSGMAALAAVAIGAGFFVQQAAEVRRERDRAAAAVAVLRESFTAADPLRVGGEPASARGVLEGAGQRLLPLIRNDPETYFPVALDLAETQLSLGLVSEASAAWIEDAMAVVAPGDPWALRRGLVMASLAIAREQGERSALLLGELERRFPGRREVDLLKARLAIVEERVPEARALLEPLWRDGGGEGQDLALVAWSLAEALRIEGSVEEAGSLLDRLLQAQTSHGGAPGPEGMVTTIRLADVEVQRRESARALQRLDAAWPDVARYFGQQSTTYALLHAIRGRAFVAEGRYADAAKAFRRAADAYSGSLGPGHRNTLRTRFNQAQALSLTEGRLGEAIALYGSLAAAATSTMAADDPLLHFILEQRISVLLRAGQWDEARQALRELTDSAIASRADAVDQRRWAALVDRVLSAEGPCRPGTPRGTSPRERAQAITCEEP